MAATCCNQMYSWSIFKNLHQANKKELVDELQILLGKLHLTLGHKHDPETRFP